MAGGRELYVARNYMAELMCGGCMIGQANSWILRQQDVFELGPTDRTVVEGDSPRDSDR